jgi:fructokinase
VILCCGEALIDMVPLKTGMGFLPCTGGSPYNTAIAIGRLGVSARFLGRLSTDFFGGLLIKGLEDNKVGTDLIVRSRENSTLAFVKLEEGREPQYVFYTEGTADRSFNTGDLPPVLPPDTRCILFGSIAMTMEPIASAIEHLIRREASRTNTGGTPDDPPVFSFDPNVRPFMIPGREGYLRRFEKWAAAAVIVKISRADFDFLYPGLPLEEAMKGILARGPRMVAATLGREGALALLRRDDGSLIRTRAPVVDLPVIDTIGAGDTFHGALLSWLELKGKMSRSALGSLSTAELTGALLFANKAASLVCSKQGANPPTLAEVEALG